MKAKFLAAILIITTIAFSMAVPVHSEEPTTYKPTYTMKPYSLSKRTGTWTTTETAITSKNDSAENNFAVSNIHLNKSHSLTYEANITMPANGQAGLVFGIANRPNPQSWYSLSIDKEKREVRLSSVNKGIVGLNSNMFIPISETDLSLSNYSLKLEITHDAEITCYFNGSLVGIFQETDFPTGYIGLITNNSQATFEDIIYGTQKPESALIELDIEDTNIKDIFRNSKYGYYFTVPEKTDTVSVRALAKKGYSVKINDVLKETTDIPLTHGPNRIEITTINDRLNIETVTVVKIIRDIGHDNKYTENYRPFFHFTPLAFNLGNLCGLVYNSFMNEYHMFYEYTPNVFEDVNRPTWGHAVSTDLVHWRNLPTALDNDFLGSAGAGSTVIDLKNTSGMFEGIPPGSRMASFFTYIEPNNVQSIGLAVSFDGGYSWSKYPSPVLPNEGNARYDEICNPKITWVDDDTLANGGFWVMLTGGSKLRMFTSINLTNWSLVQILADIDGNQLYTDTPDLFRLETEDSKGSDSPDEKWVLSLAGDSYILGDLIKIEEKGKCEFVPTSEQIKLFDSDNTPLYGAHTMFNDPNRTLLINRIKDDTAPEIDDKGWNGMLSVFMELKLIKANGSYRLFAYPIEELELSRSEKPIFETENQTVSSTDNNILSDITAKTYDIELSLDFETASKFGFKLRSDGNNESIVEFDSSNILSADFSNSGAFGSTPYSINVVPTDNNSTVNLRILVDTSVISIFANYGSASYTQTIYPSSDADKLEFFVTDGSVKIEKLTIWEMNNSWHDKYTPDQTVYIKENPNMLVHMSISLVIFASCSAVIFVGNYVYKKKKKA